MTEHTKEPWATTKAKPRKVHAGGVLICTAVLRNSATTAQNASGKSLEEATANARRIVDCVNALAGIPDPAAYVQALGVILRALEAVIDATSSYLPPDGISKDECISRVLQASDNAEVFAALQAFRQATGEVV